MQNLKNAIAYAQEKKGLPIRKGYLATKIWADSNIHSARANFTNLINGKTRKIDLKALTILCEELGVSADYLIGLSPFPNHDEEMRELKEKLDSLYETTSKIF